MKILRALAIMAALGLGGPAAAELLECNVTPDEKDNGWLSQAYFFDIDATKGSARVNDGLIQYYAKGPIDGKLAKYTDGQIVVTWDVITVSITGQRTKMTFRGTYFVKLNQFQLTSKPFGYSNVYDATGTCKVM